MVKAIPLISDLLIIYLLVLVMSNWPAQVWGKSVKFNANWRVIATGDDNQDQNINTYQQRYYLQWLPQLTERVFLGASIDYNQRWITSQGERSNLSPRASLNINNDIFRAQLNGYYNRSSEEGRNDLNENSWYAEIGSTWTNYLWPQLTFRGGQSWRTRDGEASPTDETNDWGEADIFWQYKSITTRYNYYYGVGEDIARQTETTTEKHFGSIEYTDQFWDNRLNIDFGQTADIVNTDYTAAAGDDGTALVNVNISQARAGNDSSPSTGSLPSAPGLINGDTNQPVYTIDFNMPANLAIRTDFQEVDRIYVYTSRDDRLLVSDTALVTWDVYTSNDGVVWNRQIIGAPSVYNTDEFRFEIGADTDNALFLKLVVTGWIPGVEINVTEMEAWRFLSGNGIVDSNQRRETYKTNLNLALRPTMNTWLRYTMLYDQTENSSGSGTDRLSHTASFSWFISRYFEPSVTASNTSTDYTETDDTEYRNYGLVIRSQPLETYETSVGLTRYENYKNGDQTSNNVSLSWNNSATLYPNLTSDLDLNYYVVEDTENSSESNLYNVRFSLLSRLRRNLLFDFITRYGAQDIEYINATGSSDQSGGETTFKVNYYPSDILSFLLVGSVGYGYQSDDQSSILFDTRLNLFRTNKTNITAGYTLNASDRDTLNSFILNWNWNLSEFFTLDTNANYIIRDEGNSWNISARLNTAF